MGRSVAEWSEAGKSLVVGLLFAVLSAWVAPLAASAQDYPTKPIHLIVPTPPGAPVDVLGRKVAEGLAAKLHAIIVVENRPGASGTIGANEVAKAPADGYTMVFMVGDPFTAAIALMKTPPYDPRTAFKYISKVAEDGPVLIAAPSFKPNTLQELVAEAKVSEVRYGSFGPGSFPQITMEALSKQTGAKFGLVQYRGSPAAAQALLGNEVPLTFAAANFTRSLVAEGKAKPIAALGKRSAVLPDVPSFPEAGADGPLFRNTVWIGLAGPAGLPAPIVDKVYGALKEALAEPAMQKFVSDTGWAIVGNTPGDFEQQVKSEYAIVDQLIKERGIVGE